MFQVNVGQIYAAHYTLRGRVDTCSELMELLRAIFFDVPQDLIFIEKHFKEGPNIISP